MLQVWLKGNKPQVLAETSYLGNYTSYNSFWKKQKVSIQF